MGSIILKSLEQIELIRESALIVSRTLVILASEIKPGVTSLELDKIAETYIRDQGAEPGFLGLYDFPKPLAGRSGCDFSFSGLKTAVRYKVDNFSNLTKQNQADLAASFQETIVSILNDRCANAIAIFQEKNGSNGIFVAAGGVAANMQIRNGLTSLASDYNMDFIAPPLNLCTDNAAMIAWAGLEKLKIGHCTNLDFAPRPRWPLNEL